MYKALVACKAGMGSSMMLKIKADQVIKENELPIVTQHGSLDSIADFGAMNAVYAEYFTADMPARICFEVAKLPMGALVEIDAVAVK